MRNRKKSEDTLWLTSERINVPRDEHTYLPCPSPTRHQVPDGSFEVSLRYPNLYQLLTRIHRWSAPYVWQSTNRENSFCTREISPGEWDVKFPEDRESLQRAFSQLRDLIFPRMELYEIEELRAERNLVFSHFLNFFIWTLAWTAHGRPPWANVNNKLRTSNCWNAGA